MMMMMKNPRGISCVCRRSRDDDDVRDASRCVAMIRMV